MSAKVATFVKDVTENFRDKAECYRLEPPLEGADYVVVSAATVPYSGPETYIFKSDADGKVSEWGELDGSYRGGLDIEEALRGAGYTAKR